MPCPPVAVTVYAPSGRRARAPPASEGVIALALREQFPSRGVLRRPQLRWVDLLVGGAVFALLYGLLRLGLSLRAPFVPSHSASTISTDPSHLPVYALRSLTRMLIALFL